MKFQNKIQMLSTAVFLIILIAETACMAAPSKSRNKTNPTPDMSGSLLGAYHTSVGPGLGGNLRMGQLGLEGVIYFGMSGSSSVGSSRGGSTEVETDSAVGLSGLWYLDKASSSPYLGMGLLTLTASAKGSDYRGAISGGADGTLSSVDIFAGIQGSEDHFFFDLRLGYILNTAMEVEGISSSGRYSYSATAEIDDYLSPFYFYIAGGYAF